MQKDPQPRTLTSFQKKFLPTSKDVHFFAHHGWYVTEKILSDALLDEALHGIQRYYRGERDSKIPQSGSYYDWSPDQGNVMRLNGYLSLQIKEIRKLVTYPIIAAIAARLVCADTIRLFHDRLIYKPQGIDQSETVIGWHTDRRYWRTCTSLSLLTASIPFQTCTEEMGPLVVIDSSNQWAGNNGLKAFSKRTMEELEKNIKTGTTPVQKIPLILEKGQVSFHHCLTIHGSPPNLSNVPRLSLSIHLQDGKNRYQKYLNDTGRPLMHINDTLCRRNEEGNPDYTDPEIFPILWGSGEDLSFRG